MTKVAVTARDNYQQEVVARDHYLFADEPLDVGGDDTGPTPYELLLAALGACTSITVRMYAQRKGWPLEGVEIELAHHKEHAADCQACVEGGKEHQIDIVELKIVFKGDLDDEQRARLREIAHRCPVNRTLTNGLKTVHTEI